MTTAEITAMAAAARERRIAAEARRAERLEAAAERQARVDAEAAAYAAHSDALRQARWDAARAVEAAMAGSEAEAWAAMAQTAARAGRLAQAQHLLRAVRRMLADDAVGGWLVYGPGGEAQAAAQPVTMVEVAEAAAQQAAPWHAAADAAEAEGRPEAAGRFRRSATLARLWATEELAAQAAA